MLVKCPKCSTGFNLPKEKIPGGGAKLKCSACTHKFRVRIGSDGEAEYFYKKGEQPAPGFDDDSSPGTAIGSPNLGADVEDGESTQFGFNARSKSADKNYNPFPLAAGAQDDDDDGEEESDAEEHGNSTQLFGGVGQPVDVSDDAIELDDDAEDSGNRTQIGGASMAFGDDSGDDLDIEPEVDEAHGDRTSLGVPGRSGPSGPPKVPSDESAADGNRTQALGSGMDLFEGDDFFGDDDASDASGKAKPPAGASAKLSSNLEDDPFGDAFSEPIDGDVGLLMPSTPSMDAGVIDGLSTSSSATGLEEVSASGMSEESLFLGGGHSDSDFGSADELVDPNFGADVASFDADAGVVESAERPRNPERKEKEKRRESGQFGVASDEKIELVDVRTEERERKQTADRPKRESQRTDEPPRQTGEHKREKRPVASGYAPHRVGAASPIRRTFDVLFIALVVVNVAVIFIGVRAGGFIDLTRFGHMLEVAFEGAEFEPREEWKVVVEAEPVEPPPDEPLRLRDVKAFEQKVGDQTLFVVHGKIRNYSAKSFSGIELRAEVVDPDDKVLAEQTQPGGRALDVKKAHSAKTPEEVMEAVKTKIPDVGKEGTIEFAFVFDDVPAKALESGAYSYRVALNN